MATILIVDDNPANREYLATLLNYGGHTPIEAQSGAEALARTRAERPDLVIADILMPAMDGFEFVRQLRADPDVASTSVIFHTAAYSEREARTLARQCGVDHILTKPAEPGAVLGIVNAALGVSPPPLAPAPPESFDRAHLQLMTDKLSQKVAELEAVSQRLSVLVELGQQLAAEHDALRLLHTACRAARELVGAQHAAIGLLGDQGQGVRYFEMSGLDAAQLSRLSQPAVNSGVLHTVIAERHVAHVRNPGGEPQALGLPADHPSVFSFLGAPIASAARVYGWLGLRNKLGADDFSEEDERLTGTLAAQTAVAYENLLRYDEIQRYAAELERRVDERTTELRRSNAELEQFAYIASHDLQEPLRKVVGYTQLLARRYQGRLDADADEFIGYAVDGAKRMQDLIQDLLTYSRVGREPKEPARVECETVLQTALDNLRGTIEDGGATVTHDPLPQVTADDDQLVQLFQNLIGNAIKFRGSEPARVHVSASRAEDAGPPEWIFSVRDNGIGLDPKHAERIFQVFQRLHTRAEYPGTGIGLAICKKVVERHGGRIWMESEPGRGATFYFTLPA